MSDGGDRAAAHQDMNMSRDNSPHWCGSLTAVNGLDGAPITVASWRATQSSRHHHATHLHLPSSPQRGARLSRDVFTHARAPHATDRGDAVPDNVREASALVFMGGPMSVNDPLPWIADELRLIRAACTAGMPVLGHCLGGQLIAKALGAEVRRNAVKEIGWHPVEQSDASIWLDVLPRRFEVFLWLGETFDLSPGAVPLLRSFWCEHQAFARGSAHALQCHIEMTSAMVSEWAELGRDELQSRSPSVQSPQTMTAELAVHVAALHRVADVIYRRWLDQVQG